MSNKYQKSESPIAALKNESARQRWELFHRAIAHAKESNNASLVETEMNSGESDNAAPLLSILR